MLITDLHVDGFGQFANFRLEGLGPRMNLIVGPNEAGKTTLHAFMRAVLYGFPDGRSRQNTYLPTGGGPYGGVLILQTEKGRHVIRRVLDSRTRTILSITLPDGTEGNERDLEKILGGHSEQVFSTVFSFGLEALYDADSLESVSDRIYSTGLGLGNVSLPDIERVIEKERGEIFKPRGRGQRMNRALHDLDEIGKQLKEVGHRPQDYDLLKKERATVEIKREEVEQKAREAIQRASRLKVMLNIHD
ncbi:MAG: AAA family ATPase, partial [Pseudomonadota bacterium]